ncbi:MAG: zinc ribbon domain-containing protein [Clostridia bacterium]|nr:zinc ribbon domain-containing protein [Clostridia bacterium]
MDGLPSRYTRSDLSLIFASLTRGGSQMSRIRQNAKRNGPLARILISLLGLAMILLGVSRFALFFVGETSYADVNTRRVGGADNQYSADKRYEWSIDYSFIDAQGEVHDGHTTRRGGDMGVKVESTVYYWPAAPFINGLEREVEPNLGQLVLVGIGILLIVLMNRKSGRAMSRRQPAYPSASQSQGATLDDYDDSVEELYHQPAPGTRFCAECGTPLSATTRFCPHCGSAVK